MIMNACFLTFTKAGAQSEKVWFAIKDGMENQALASTIENNTTTFLMACNDAIQMNKKPDFPTAIFAKNAKPEVATFWDNSPMNCSKSYISEKCVKKSSGGYQVRNIPVFIPDAPEEKQNQEIVIDFTADGKIDNVSISIEETRVRAILEEFNSLEDFNRRQIIIGFLENFRTAYNRKDMKYIETVYSDNALIITGKVVKLAPSKDKAINALLGTEKIVYTTLTKKEYMNSLKLTFGRNKYIDVEFDDIDVVSHPKNDKLYGVTLKQKWGSSTYNDTGYLFLMIDFKDEAWPMIHVRTWQPDKFEGKELPKDQIFNLNDFNINI
jgi:predicted nucleic acid-binding protein